MKKQFTAAGAVMFLAAVLLIVIMAASSVQAYADTYSTDIDAGEATKLNWGATFDSDAVTYIKIKPSKKGTITFTANFNCGVALCNSKKKVVSIGSYSSGDDVIPTNTNAYMHKVHYGVKKKATYYLRLNGMPSSQDEYGNYTGTVKYTNAKVKPAKYGKSKKKAKAIKKNKKIKGLFTAGNKKAQWYKITNKQKTTKIKIKGDKINYRLNFKVYYKSYNKWYNVTYPITWQKEYNSDTLTGTVNIKAKHTYYIKVYPEGKSSGAYSIKWK